MRFLRHFSLNRSRQSNKTSLHGHLILDRVSPASASTVRTGQSLQLTATLAPNSYNGTLATGTVTFYDNGVQTGTAQALNGAKAVLTTAGLTAGSHT